MPPYGIELMPRRDLEIEYNVLNLPQTSSNGGIMFRYDYLSNGEKASVIDDEDNAMVYLGSLVYYNGEDSGGYKLESTGEILDQYDYCASGRSGRNQIKKETERRVSDMTNAVKATENTRKAVASYASSYTEDIISDNFKNHN